MPAVSYRILVDGEPLSPEILAAVSTLEVEDHAHLADMLRLRLSVAVKEDWSGWTVLDDDPFPRLARVTVTASVGPRTRETLIDAYVIEVTARLSEKPGLSTLDVVAMDPSVLLHLDEKVRGWPDMSDGDIARQVFADHGFEADVDATEPTREAVASETVQRGTDMQLLRFLAERNGFEVYVETDPRTGSPVGHFHAPRLDRTPQGVLSVAHGASTNVDEFAATFDMLRPAVVAAAGLAASDHSEHSASADEVAVSTLGKDSLLPRDRPRRTLLSATGAFEAPELQAAAQAEVDRSAWALSAEGRLSTAAYGAILRAKRTVAVRGAGRRFSGTWYVERVLHRLAGASYTQEFTLRRNGIGVTGEEDFRPDGDGGTP
ncbi:MAG: contractile injection system protein, VgrG/Pvc8 family [Planctomycetota bacterium]